jgi:hypothetical protein
MVNPTVPTLAMIFTHCAEGITHHNNERAELAYTAPGVNVRVKVFVHAAAARASR